MEMPLEAIEEYLSHGLKEIADLHGVHRFGCRVVLWTPYRSAMGEQSQGIAMTFFSKPIGFSLLTYSPITCAVDRAVRD